MPPPLAPRGAAHRRTGMNGWAKGLIAALALAVVVAVVVVIYLAVGVHKATDSFNNSTTAKPGRPSGYHGPAYAGMIVQDRVAGGPGTSIDFSGQVLTAGALTHTTSYFGPTLCSPVTITNHSQTVSNVSPADWKLQQPNGRIETFAITGTLQGGQIAPGGTASGTVCFADSGQTGHFVLLWQPIFQVPRGVWLLQY